MVERSFTARAVEMFVFVLFLLFVLVLFVCFFFVFFLEKGKLSNNVKVCGGKAVLRIELADEKMYSIASLEHIK